MHVDNSGGSRVWHGLLGRTPDWGRAQPVSGCPQRIRHWTLIRTTVTGASQDYASADTDLGLTPWPVRDRLAAGVGDQTPELSAAPIPVWQVRWRAVKTRPH